MRPDDYYEFLLDKQPLAKWRAIRSWACRRYNMKQGEFELVMELYQLEEFTTDDFHNCSLLLNWNQHRWDNFKAQGWVQLYRERAAGANRRYSIWRLSREMKSMVKKCYRIIAGLDPIPEEIFNKKRHTDKRVKKYLNTINDGN